MFRCSPAAMLLAFAALPFACGPNSGPPDGAGDAALDAAADAADAADVMTRPSSPDPWAGRLAIPRFTDRNPDPRIIEVDLEARVAEWEISAGRTVRAYTYNGTVPGPMLEGNVGDTVIVHFTNRLPDPTTIHWHGMRVPHAADGTHHTQMPVMPGATYDYRFALADAGLFWYHPHLMTDSQVERGLYAPIVVRGAGEPVVDREGVLMLDDVRLGMDGQIAPIVMTDDLPGREGSILLTNGHSDGAIPIRAGATQRWRIVNASNARYFNLSLAGHRFLVLGADMGFYPQPREVDNYLLVPGERVDILVRGTGMPGNDVALQSLPYNRGYGGGSTTPLDVIHVQYTMDAAIPALAPPTSFPAIMPLAVAGVMQRDVRFGMMLTGTVTLFTINGQAAPNVPVITARVNQTEVWDIINATPGDHPFHLHGFSYQVISRAGMPESAADLIWRDTINIPRGQTIRIAWRPDNRPGMWMYHCHILEHAEHGMLGEVDVQP